MSVARLALAGFLLAAIIVAGTLARTAPGPAAVAEVAQPTDEPDLSSAVELRSPWNPREILDLVYLNRPDSALVVLDAYLRLNPNDPFPLLLKAKVLRERLNDEDNNKELIKRSAEPIHSVLDSAIAMSDQALERDVKNYKQYYYRGYAWLSKAQLYVLGRGYWSAGRAASRGKDDLERYLDKYPDDADARGALGAYYYFADAIPGFIKFVAKLLLIPSGDREKGLDMLRYAATHEGVFSADWSFVVAAIDLVFEGHFERGTDELIALLRDYPYYTRLAEPIAVAAPLYPARAREIREIVSGALEAHLTLDESRVDWNLVSRMRLVQAFTDSYFGSPSEAVARFTTLIDDPPRHPDWVVPIALLNRGYLLQRQGSKGDALDAFAAVRASEHMSRYHRSAELMLASVDAERIPVGASDLDFVPMLYDGGFDEAREGLERWKSIHGEDAICDFYTGDLEAMRGDLGAARRAYERALARVVLGGEQVYQTFSAARLAEIAGGEGRYDEARDLLKRAPEYCHANYLLDFLMEARARFYELVDSGKLSAKPDLLRRRDGDS
jgi:tetratricopeptide (TPR) repeat protein